MEGQSPTFIYVLPTEEGLPPRAMVGQMIELEDREAVATALATWVADNGRWEIEGTPVPNDMGEAITEHAKTLGVEW